MTAANCSLKDEKYISGFGIEESRHLESINTAELRPCKCTSCSLGEAAARPFASIRVEAAKCRAIICLNGRAWRKINHARAGLQTLLAKFLQMKLKDALNTVRLFLHSGQLNRKSRRWYRTDMQEKGTLRVEAQGNRKQHDSKSRLKGQKLEG